MKYVLIFLTACCLSFCSCSGCSKSGRIHGNKRNAEYGGGTSAEHTNKTSVQMKKRDGVYQIPVDVNGVRMFFIFDTGASLISISETEANFLYKQGKLTDDDIKGTVSFSDANGDISEGTIIILKTVQIGDRTLSDVEASVVHNLKAPLLIGQSALGKFGKISIDNSLGQITFE